MFDSARGDASTPLPETQEPASQAGFEAPSRYGSERSSNLRAAKTKCPRAARTAGGVAQGGLAP